MLALMPNQDSSSSDEATKEEEVTREHQSEATGIPPRSALTRPLETVGSDLMGTGHERLFYDAKPARDRCRMPRLTYGAAWKHERTEELVNRALKAGFRAFDTAAQPCKYDEVGVGRAIWRAVGKASCRGKTLSGGFPVLPSEDDRDEQTDPTGAGPQIDQNQVRSRRVPGPAPYAVRHHGAAGTARAAVDGEIVREPGADDRQGGAALAGGGPGGGAADPACPRGRWLGIMYQAYHALRANRELAVSAEAAAYALALGLNGGSYIHGGAGRDDERGAHAAGCRRTRGRARARGEGGRAGPCGGELPEDP
ncbi:hypothetical protein DL770_001486 [Monosporascus sp. CRB-9-2]|nr:hypothetical protein DL770_001486 [Monosporascus sp. CRB-9-2]